MRRRSIWLIVLVLSACSGVPGSAPTPRPTFGPILSAGHTDGVDAGNTISTQPAATSAMPAPSAAPMLPSPDPSSAADPLEQYRRWVDEARLTHPYSATADLMWDVLLCESSGDPQAEGPGGLIGLFQYTPQTWDGAWNPYRDQPLNDARAQIWATAKAWSDGNQQWWSVCLP